MRMIVGMPRSGTQWLLKLFNERKDTAAFGETLFWSRWYVPPREDGAYDDEQIQRAVTRLKRHAITSVAGSEPGCLKNVTMENLPEILDRAFADFRAPATPAELFRHLAATIAEAEGATIGIEKTPNHVNWIDRIIEAMPEVRFVVAMREPYGFMLSYKHLLDNKSYTFKWRYHPVMAALAWRTFVRSVRAAKHTHPDHIEVIWLHEIKKDSRAVLERVQRFFMLPVEDDLAERVPPDNSSFRAGKRPELKSEDIFWMNLLTGKEIAASGFERRKIPFQPLRIIGSCILLPFWSLVKVYRLNRNTDGSLTEYVWKYLRPGRASDPDGADAPLS